MKTSLIQFLEKVNFERWKTISFIECENNDLINHNDQIVENEKDGEFQNDEYADVSYF